jgi:antitoxin component of RelBE/YafQ-DinJ toxin-antitoxin module
MTKSVTLSTNIDAQIKEALSSFCKKKGLKIQHFVEKAILEQLEDAIDLEAYYERKDEETISFDELIR